MQYNRPINLSYNITAYRELVELAINFAKRVLYMHTFKSHFSLPFNEYNNRPHDWHHCLIYYDFIAAKTLEKQTSQLSLVKTLGCASMVLNALLEYIGYLKTFGCK